jgi:hypothetical protein
MVIGTIVNGDASINGHSTLNGSRPRTPSLKSLSLTEYSTNPSPPSNEPKNKIRGVVPDEFLLPTGYPDVCLFFVYRHVSMELIELTIVVFTPNPRFTSIRSSQRNPAHPRHQPQQSIRMQRPTKKRRPSARLQLQAKRGIQ